jgi:hypothetical protein
MAEIAELIKLITTPAGLLLTVLIFGFMPGFLLRLIVMMYPPGHVRRRELPAELYKLGRLERIMFVAEQFETAIFEGIGSRIANRRRGRGHDETDQSSSGRPKGIEDSNRPDPAGPSEPQQPRDNRIDKPNVDRARQASNWRDKTVTPFSPLRVTPTDRSGEPPERTVLTTEERRKRTEEWYKRYDGMDEDDGPKPFDAW